MAHILLAHDHPTVRHAVATYLERFGHTVTTAPNARTALERAGPETDVVVADIALPSTGGVGLRYALGERALFPRLVLLSDRYPHEQEAAASDFVLLQPFEPEQLDRAVRGVLHRPYAGRGVAAI